MQHSVTSTDNEGTQSSFVHGSVHEVPGLSAHFQLKTEDISGCVCDVSIKIRIVNILSGLSVCVPTKILSPQVPRLVSYLEYQCLSEALLGALVDVSQASPSSLFGLLPALRIVGQQFPALLGHVAKIHGSVGVISKVQTHANKNTHTHT